MKILSWIKWPNSRTAITFRKKVSGNKKYKHNCKTNKYFASFKILNKVDELKFCYYDYQKLFEVLRAINLMNFRVTIHKKKVIYAWTRTHFSRIEFKVQKLGFFKTCVQQIVESYVMFYIYIYI